MYNIRRADRLILTKKFKNGSMKSDKTCVAIETLQTQTSSLLGPNLYKSEVLEGPAGFLWVLRYRYINSDADNVRT